MTKLLTIILLLIAIVSYAQSEEDSQVNLGFGLGLDYGGIGARLSFLPDKNIALFGAIGYNLHKAGINVGGSLRVLPGRRVVPVVLAMYGYNGVIVVKGASQYNKTYYGPSLGAGVEVHSRNGQNFSTIELLLPFRPAEFDNDLDALFNNPNITITRPLPIAFSFGYHFKF